MFWNVWWVRCFFWFLPSGQWHSISSIHSGSLWRITCPIALTLIVKKTSQIIWKIYEHSIFGISMNQSHVIPPFHVSCFVFCFKVFFTISIKATFFSWWWFQTYFIFNPNLGEIIQFDEHIFQTGWNHQLVFVCLFSALFLVCQMFPGQKSGPGEVCNSLWFVVSEVLMVLLKRPLVNENQKSIGSTVSILDCFFVVFCLNEQQQLGKEGLVGDWIL